jgi:methylmalonyl-CoA mutase N-terminal domain/subunit
MALAEGEVSKVRRHLDSLKGMQTLFHGIKLGYMTSMTINATGYILLSL